MTVASSSFRTHREHLGNGPIGPLERAVAVSFVSVSLKLAPFPLPHAPPVVMGGAYWREPWNSAEAWAPRAPVGYAEEDET